MLISLTSRNINYSIHQSFNHSKEIKSRLITVVMSTKAKISNRNSLLINRYLATLCLFSFGTPTF